MHRRELFGRVGSLFDQEAKKGYIRPPYYGDGNSFYEHCKVCDGACAKVCETNIIVILKDKTPVLDFGQSGCSYCDECAIACDFEVLSLEDKAHIDATISIDTQGCMSWHQTICFACKEPCLDDAINFEGMFNPIIDINKCSSCGFCIAKCPTNAIEIKRGR